MLHGYVCMHADISIYLLLILLARQILELEDDIGKSFYTFHLHKTSKTTKNVPQAGSVSSK